MRKRPPMWGRVPEGVSCESGRLCWAASRGLTARSARNLRGVGRGRGRRGEARGRRGLAGDSITLPGVGQWYISRGDSCYVRHNR